MEKNLLQTWRSRLGLDRLGGVTDSQSVAALLERKQQRRLARNEARENPGAAQVVPSRSKGGVFKGRRGPVITWHPRPLLNADKRLIVLWSPKSACTTVYVWFAKVSGFLDEVKAANKWPHVHRSAVFYHSDLYRRSLDGDLDGWRVVRVIRDPYARAVSIYRHALKTNFLEEEVHAHFGGRVSSEKGYSFMEFLGLLGTFDMTSCNPHCRPQFHPFEGKRRPDVTINISKQDLFTALNEVEDSLQLPRSNVAELTWLNEMEHKRKAKQVVLDGGEMDQVPFTRQAARGQAPFPQYDQLLTPAARTIVKQIYRIDFEAYSVAL